MMTGSQVDFLWCFKNWVDGSDIWHYFWLGGFCEVGKEKDMAPF